MAEITVRDQILDHMDKTGETVYALSNRQNEFSSGAVQQFLYSGRNAKVSLVDALLDALDLVLVPVRELRELRRVYKYAKRLSENCDTIQRITHADKLCLVVKKIEGDRAKRRAKRNA